VSARILFLIFVSCKFSKKYEQVNAYYSLKTLQLNVFWHLLSFKFLNLLNFIFKIWNFRGRYLQYMLNSEWVVGEK